MRLLVAAIAVALGIAACTRVVDLFPAPDAGPPPDAHVVPDAKIFPDAYVFPNDGAGLWPDGGIGLDAWPDGG